MSKQLFQISWNELSTLRLTCRSCKFVFEVPISDLDPRKTQNPIPKCPKCNETFLLDMGNGNSENVLYTLGRLATAIKIVEEQKLFNLEFLIPDHNPVEPGKPA